MFLKSLKRVVFLRDFMVFVLSLLFAGIYTTSHAQELEDSELSSFTPMPIITPIEPELDTIEYKIRFPWIIKGDFNVGVDHAIYQNWSNGGGDNFLGLKGKVVLEAIYDSRRFRWENAFKTELGMKAIFNPNEELRVDKSVDVIEFSTNLEYKITSKWNVVARAFASTQYLKSITTDNEFGYNSNFLSPAKLKPSMGIAYKPHPFVKISLSPIAGDFTFVYDQKLANLGLHGLEPAILNADGTIFTAAKRSKYRFGAYFLAEVVDAKFWKDKIGVRAKLELFSEYAHNPQNIDVTFEAEFSFALVKYLSLNLSLGLAYDDDIKTIDKDGLERGAKFQFRESVSIGFSYNFNSLSKQLLRY